MRSAAIGLVFILAGNFACNKGQEPPPPSTGRPHAERESGPGGDWAPVGKADVPTPAIGDPAKKAKAMYAMVCQMCHGETGRGDGAASANLGVKPRNYTDAAWQASVTDADLKKVILGGGPAVGKSAIMPGQPQLEKDPEVLAGLVAIIRGFKQ